MSLYKIKFVEKGTLIPSTVSIWAHCRVCVRRQVMRDNSISHIISITRAKHSRSWLKEIKMVFCYDKKTAEKPARRCETSLQIRAIKCLALNFNNTELARLRAMIDRILSERGKEQNETFHHPHF